MAEVMIVEDEVLVALDVAAVLEEAGHRIKGPYHSHSTAMDALGTGYPDLAILDVNLRGDTSLKLAECLAEEGVPFAFLTGYATSDSRLSASFPDAMRLNKPCSPNDLLRAVHDLSGNAAG